LTKDILMADYVATISQNKDVKDLDT